MEIEKSGRSLFKTEIEWRSKKFWKALRRNTLYCSVTLLRTKYSLTFQNCPFWTNFVMFYSHRIDWKSFGQFGNIFPTDRGRESGKPNENSFPPLLFPILPFSLFYIWNFSFFFNPILLSNTFLLIHLIWNTLIIETNNLI